MSLTAKSALNLMVVAALTLGLIFAANPQAREWARHAWLDLQAEVRLLLNRESAQSSRPAQGEASDDLTIAVGLGQTTPTPAP